MSELLRVEGLRTWFHTNSGVVRAVDGVDLVMEQGRTLGIVGESGSGKSVTALSIMGLIDAPGKIQPGSRILFEGRDLVRMPESELQAIRGNEIAMVFQEPMTSLNPVYRVGDQIAEAARAHTDLGRKDSNDIAIEMLQLVGVPAAERKAQDYPHEMSGGMRQRVMIAMALVGRPKLLIADEPTTALDVTIQAQILELLLDLRARFSMSVMMITHDLGVIAEMVDEVAVMYAGQVVERGTVDAIFRSPQHPYTEALLQSIPVLGMPKDERLKVIRGSVPNPAAWPQACRFAQRCDYAFERCYSEAPPLFDLGDQAAACWLCAEGMRPTSPSRKRRQ